MAVKNLRAEAHSLPVYRGTEHVSGQFPTSTTPWLKPGKRLYIGGEDGWDLDEYVVEAYLHSKPWVLPSREHLFFTDIHADADALLNSLVASGGVIKTGDGDQDFELSETGSNATFVFGGDYFDKGPSNIRLLRALKQLVDLKADVVFVAGNHDVRAYLGLVSAEAKEPHLAHLFVRMGKKSITLFKEVFDEYVDGKVKDFLSEEEVKDRLFPPESWWDDFPQVAAATVPGPRITKELRRVREKCAELTQCAHDVGLSFGQLYASLQACRRLFIEPDGEFAWLFERMRVAYRAGSVLFVHAGVDDQIAEKVRARGVNAVNQEFRDLLIRDPFQVYNGPLGNMFRTKYRPIDFLLTSAGVANLHAHGVYIVVHGHRNLTTGQRLTMRCGMLNFECDASVDSNTRTIEGLDGHGWAVTIFRSHEVIGMSADNPEAKLFRPTDVCGQAMIVSYPDGRRAAM